MASASQFKQDYNMAVYGDIEPAEDIFTWDENEDMSKAIIMKLLNEGTCKISII